MAIWLKTARSATGEADAQGWVMRVGASSDVIARESFGELVSLEAAYEALALQRDAVLDAARDDAAAIVEAGHATAGRIAEAAQHEYDVAHEQGYRDGSDRARADWMERLAEFADLQNQLQISMRERLASIVSSAVEQIVRVERHDALFDRALMTVDRIIDGAAYLRVVIHPDDYAEAKATFDRLEMRWRDLGKPIPLSVVADKRLEPGSCVCETDIGNVDASLGTQLRAMRGAVSRALKCSVEEAEEERLAAQQYAPEACYTTAEPALPGDDDEMKDDDGAYA